MDFSEEEMSRGIVKQTLPQFSELRSAPIAVASTNISEYTDSGNVQSQTVQTSVQTDTAGSSQKQTSTNASSKYFATPLPGWQDTLLQLCEKRFFNEIIVPSYSQNNGILGVQSNSLSFINNLCFPSTSQTDNAKQESDIQLKEQKNSDKESEIQEKHQTAAAMAEYLQKLPADVSLRDVFKLYTEQIKKEKIQEEKIEHTQNNILNIPNVRNIYLQNSNFANSDQMTVAVNPNDLNLQNEQEIENSLPNVLKVEQQVQTDLPSKIEKKSKFRAKMGEIKVSINFDGVPLYCCPECNLGLPNKTDIEQHIQTHLQERKYECKLCGAMLKRKEHLDQHMRGHSDERPFKCPLCHKAFKRNEHLTRHCVIHSGTKDFPCTMCTKAFSRKDHLNKHLQTHLGIRKNKKEDLCYIDQKDTTRIFDNSTDIATMPKQEVNYIVKDSSFLKQETTLLQHIQNLHKNPTLLHTFASLKEQVMKDANVSEQAQSGNMNENIRYLMPS
ncbi:zinc finger protein ZFP69-like [Pogonomyrmex barbatus]|uniref:Zinc finger protein ZFP69-like n=1 Tax=Pogonomyrmex barbatus TaxID=144034 RepID=A0A6I9WIW0_9HYME|nr:zinc finger protein ZFP69-like [Pogonomyrmex barbatus]XP_011642958.1 zinc finger protein ZFP69-like [Pogonomyrmex barbatus]XP_011642959.1 zinc finger protein ZFP69-like [Pogonomyrmex barbatus]